MVKEKTRATVKVSLTCLPTPPTRAATKTTTATKGIIAHPGGIAQIKSMSRAKMAKESKTPNQIKTMTLVKTIMNVMVVTMTVTSCWLALSRMFESDLTNSIAQSKLVKPAGLGMKRKRRVLVVWIPVLVMLIGGR